jgi:NADPH:quinone reductase-like Zn-dependent oxidoreductase
MFEVDIPVPGPGQVKVKVAWAAVNRADLRVSSGEFVGRFLHARVSPIVLGYDFSGSVESGPGMSDLRAGEEIFGFLPYASTTRQGAFAEFVIVDRGTIGRKPQSVTHEAAAAAATPGLTALQFLRGLGADAVVDRRKQDPLSVGGPFNVVFDAAAAYSYFAFRKCIVAGGAFVSTLPSPALILGKAVAALSSKRCEFTGVKPVTADLEQLAAWLQDGLQAPIDSRFPVKNLGAALMQLTKGEVRGRVVVQIDGGF